MVAGAEPRISWSRQVSARRSTNGREPLTRFTVACHIAKTVWQCLCPYGGQWTLQDGTVVRFEDLVLLELVQVSQGSHQIVLGYLHPGVQNPAVVPDALLDAQNTSRLDLLQPEPSYLDPLDPLIPDPLDLCSFDLTPLDLDLRDLTRSDSVISNSETFGMIYPMSESHEVSVGAGCASWCWY